MKVKITTLMYSLNLVMLHTCTHICVLVYSAILTLRDMILKQLSKKMLLKNSSSKTYMFPKGDTF